MSVRDDFFTALSNGAKWEVGVSIERKNPLPIDANSVFKSLEDLNTYLAGPIAYIGQPVAVVTESDTTLYVLDQNKVPQPVGKATEGDGKTIDLNTTTGILGLHDFGKCYYKYIPATEDNDWHYEKVIVSEENPWKAGLAPQVVALANGAYEIGWYEPNASTIEGINSQVAALQGEVDAAKSSIASNASNIGTLTTDVSGLKQKLSSMGGIFNFAGSVDADVFANMAASSYDAGDVILVDGIKEYVCVEVPNAEGEGTTKRWETLGDPSGVTALQGTVGHEAYTDADGTKHNATGLIADVRTAQSNISTLQSNVATLEGQVSSLEEKDIELANAIAEKATQSALNDAVAAIGVNTTAIGALEQADSVINSELATKATITYVDNQITEVNNAINLKADQDTVAELIANAATKTELTNGLSGKVDLTTYNGKISSLESADATNEAAIGEVKKTADKAATDIISINNSLSTKAEQSVVNGIDTRLGAVETASSKNTGNIATMQGTISGLIQDKADKNALEALTSRVATNEGLIGAHETAYQALLSRVNGHDTSIQNAQADATKALTDASDAMSAAAAAMAKAEEVLGVAGDDANANTVFGAKAAAAGAQAAAEEAARLAGVAQSEVDTLEGVVNSLDSAYQSADAALGARIDAIDQVIGGVQGAMHFVGVSTIDPSTGVVVIAGKEDYEPADGDVVIYEKKETIDDVETVVATIEYVRSGSAWVELGDVSAEAKRIGALETRMAAAEVETAKVAGIQTSIGDQASALAALQARVEANEAYKGTNDKALEDLTKRVKNNEDAIAKEITDRETAIANEKSARESAIANEQSERASAVNDLQGQINSVIAKLTWTKIGE